MDEKHPEIIIIKRHSEHDEEHHGGAWKIAFADFMTAMMAFFLVLWIINATDKNTKTIIARYFNPLKLEDMAKAKKGIRQISSDESREQTSPDAESAPPAPTPPAKTKDENPKKEAAQAKDESGKKEAAAKEAAEIGQDPVDPAHPQAHFSEGALFSDPYASLDKIAGKLPPQPPNKADSAGMADAASGGEPAAKTDAAAGGDAATAAEVPDVRGFVDPFKPSAGSAIAGAPPQPPRQPTPPVAEAAPQPAANPAEPPPAPASPPEAERAPAASPDAARLQSELAKELRAETHAQPAPGIEVRQTAEGTLISLTDEINFGMFASGSAEPQPKVVRIMEKIAESLKSRPGAIIVRGFTDSRPFKSGTYDNWRLSSARAQMAYYMLIRGGVDEKRMERIEGYADRRPKIPAKPEAAENRRIEILLQQEKP
ncbi:MAG: MotB family protein [Roseiarcus sp.]